MLDLMTKMYAEMQKGFKQVYSEMNKGFAQVYGEMNKGFERVDGKFDQVNDRIDNLEKTVLKIEQEHGDKLSALFDGYKQNSQKLDRIEKEVSKHEEVILRRIR